VLADAFTTPLTGPDTGPDWLRRQRAAAAERFAWTERPDPSLEEWRYSRVDSLELDRYRVPSDVDAAVPDAALDLSAALGPYSGRLVHVDGRLVAAELSPELADRGVVFGRLDEVDAEVEALVGVDAGAPDPFSDLNLAFGPDPLVLSVPRGVTVDLPFQVLGLVTGDGALVLPRLNVVAGEDSDFTLVDWLAGGADAVVVPRVEVAVGAAARVGVVTVEELGPQADQLGLLTAVVGQEATLRLGHVALGGGYARSRFDCRLVGRGATGRLSALYLGDGDQMHDLRTFQTHEARDTTSELVFKGALDDRAHAVYTGTIRVDHEGRGSNANQTNRVIKLSDDAWAESVPNLEINHNDVRCSHATAVGPIDEDQRFYLESRGVPPEVAERLVVNGFFEEVLDAMPVPAVADRVRPLIAGKLGGGR
jgi:Fe-S cluster assembly protein SufD